MKKILLALFLVLITSPLAKAGECDVVTDVSDYWVKVKSGVNMRDKVCEGNVIGSLGAGTVVKVVGHIEDWRYIEKPGGGNAFIWSEFVEETGAPTTQAEIESPQEALYDIVGHQYEGAIRYLAEKKIVQGYPDKSYKADLDMNRAEFTKLVVGAKLGYEPKDSAKKCFSDFGHPDWFWSWVCYAKDNGIVKGFDDGEFKANEKIKLVEASKILVNTFGLSTKAETDIWYETYIQALQSNHYLPDTFNSLTQFVNRGQMAEMLWRILEEIKDQPAKFFPLVSIKDAEVTKEENPLPTTEEKGEISACADSRLDTKVDMNEVRLAWLDWHNKARADRNLEPFIDQEGLDYAASIWALDNESEGQISHERTEGQSVDDWFAGLGITFKPLNGFVYGENLGARSYSCGLSDCTEELKATLKLIFDAFMAEEGTNFTGHYDNVVEPDFKELGLGVAVDSGENMVYVTSHYAQGVENYSKTCK